MLRLLLQHHASCPRCPSCLLLRNVSLERLAVKIAGIAWCPKSLSALPESPRAELHANGQWLRSAEQVFVTSKKHQDTCSSKPYVAVKPEHKAQKPESSQSLDSPKAGFCLRAVSSELLGFGRTL